MVPKYGPLKEGYLGLVYGFGGLGIWDLLVWGFWGLGFGGLRFERFGFSGAGFRGLGFWGLGASGWDLGFTRCRELGLGSGCRGLGFRV